MKKENAPRKPSERQAVQAQDNSAQAQRQRLLRALEVGAVSTLEARRNEDILQPAARVFELRAMGWKIATLWETAETLPGKRHRVARYVLLPGDCQQRAG